MKIEIHEDEMFPVYMPDAHPSFANPNSLYEIDPDQVKTWLSAFRAFYKTQTEIREFMLAHIKPTQ